MSHRFKNVHVSIWSRPLAKTATDFPEMAQRLLCFASGPARSGTMSVSLHEAARVETSRGNYSS
jgi:hypothetical protein